MGYNIYNLQGFKLFTCQIDLSDVFDSENVSQTLFLYACKITKWFKCVWPFVILKYVLSRLGQKRYFLQSLCYLEPQWIFLIISTHEEIVAWSLLAGCQSTAVQSLGTLVLHVAIVSAILKSNHWD